MKKKFFALFLALTMVFSMVISATVIPVSAADDPVSKEKLEAIVTEKVNALDFDSLTGAIDGFIEDIQQTVSNMVTEIVKGILTSETIIDMAAPLISEAINLALNTALKDAGINIDTIDVSSIVDEILASSVIDTILSSEIAQEIIDRTITYTVDEVLSTIITIPTTNEILQILEKQKPELIQKYTNEIMAFGEEGSYEIKIPFIGTINVPVNIYKTFTVSLKSPYITYTGWASATINAYIIANIINKNAINYTDPNSIDYTDIILKSAERAAKEVITEKIAAAKVELEKIIKEEIAELKGKTAKEINNAFASIGLTINITANDIPYGIKGKIVKAVKDVSETKKAEMLVKLEALKKSAIAKLLGIQKDIENAIKEIKGEIDNATLEAKKAFIAELNQIFGANLTVDSTAKEIEAALISKVDKITTCATKEKILSGLKTLKKVEKYTCLDMGDCLDKLIAYVEKNIHIPGNKTETKAPTATAEGKWEIRCTKCDKLLDSGKIDKLTPVTATNPKFISIIETSKNSRSWVLTFSVTLNSSNGTVTNTYTINLNGNNANLSGQYSFGAGHDLAGFTLIYDIKGNGSNIKTFSIK